VISPVQGSFDCVRLSPHFAQDDIGGKGLEENPHPSAKGAEGWGTQEQVRYRHRIRLGMGRGVMGITCQEGCASQIAGCGWWAEEICW